MRTWMSTREVQSALGGLSQPRITQLVKEGKLTRELDANGAAQYDRESVNREARNRATRAALNAGEASDERAALRAEAQDRFAQQRALEREEAAERQRRLDDWKERVTIALEEIAKHLRNR